MIKVSGRDGNVEMVGTTPELLSELGVAIHTMLRKKICTVDDINRTVELSCKSDEEIEKEVGEFIKSHKDDLIKDISKIVDDLFSDLK